MICPNCKEEIADGRRICPKCGMPTASSTIRPVPEAEDNAKDIGKKIHSLDSVVKAEAERKEKERQEKKEKAEKEREEALSKLEEELKSKFEDLGLESVGDDPSDSEDFDGKDLPDFLFGDDEEEDLISEKDGSSFEEVEVLSDDSDEAPKDAAVLLRSCDYYNGRQVILEGSFLDLAEDDSDYRLSVGDSCCSISCLVPCSVSEINKEILEALKKDQKVSVKGTLRLDGSRTPYIEVSEMEGDAFFLKVD